MTPKKYSLLSIALLLLCGGVSAAPRDNRPEQEFSKKIVREFPISANGTTAVDNRFGNIKVNTWNQRLVKMEITIIVNAPDQRSADRLFEGIKINFLNTADYVKAETVVQEASSGLALLGNRKGEFSIHYDLWLPADNQLDLRNRYGDVYVSNLKGKLLAEIRYGNLRGENLSGDADLALSYGKASLNRVRNLTGSLSYADLNSEHAAEVSMDTRYSELRIAQAGQVRLTSKYDKLNFGEVGTLRIQTRYSDVRARQVSALFLTAQYTDTRIERLNNTLDTDLSYGQISVSTLGRQFTEARLQAKYTDVKISVEPGTAFRLDAKSKHTDVHTPNMMTMARVTIPGGRTNITGFAGDAKAPRIITADLQYSDFVLK